MDKSQQREIISYFSLKGRGARKIQNEFPDTHGPDVSSQAQISLWLDCFSTGDISFLGEA
jgi:hypothetical protein